MSPKTLKECWDWFNNNLSSKDVEYIKNLPSVKDTCQIHSTLGRWIRNNWGLWAGSDLKEFFKSIGLSHPDDMSSVILKSYWSQLNNQNFDLDKEIEYYQDYWKKDKQ